MNNFRTKCDKIKELLNLCQLAIVYENKKPRRSKRGFNQLKNDHHPYTTAI